MKTITQENREQKKKDILAKIEALHTKEYRARTQETRERYYLASERYTEMLGELEQLQKGI